MGYEALIRFSEDPYGFISGWEGELTGLTSTLIRSAYLRDLYKLHGSHNLSFLITLAGGCLHDCTDLRDSIYGFLGLAHGQLAEEIMPDYQCSVEKAFHNFLCSFFLAHKSLALLNLTTFKGKEKRIFPAWVPDWPRLGQIQDDAVRNWQSRMQRLAQLPYFDACRSRPLVFDPMDDTTVRLSGMCLGKIANISADAWVAGQLARKTLKLEDRWRDFFTRYTNANPAEDEGSPYWRILINDIANDFVFHKGKPIGFESYQAWIHEPRMAGWKTKKAREFHSAVKVACAGRRRFVTGHGLMGTGAAEMQKDGCVYVLAGGNLAYILRPVRSVLRPRTFELVGDCYAHGIMHGEAAGKDADFHDVFLE